MKKLGFDLILLGTPASGKDTQAELLMKKYDLKPVESGKFSRALAKKNTPEGRLLRKTMALGRPTPMPIMKRFIKSQIIATGTSQNLIFIGNPRLEPEARMVDKLLSAKKHNFLALFIRVPDAEVFRRITSRMSKHERDDDSNIQFVKNRIKWQSPTNSKAVKYFQSRRKLKFINGNQSIKKVSQDIQKIINDYQRSS